MLETESARLTDIYAVFRIHAGGMALKDFLLIPSSVPPDTRSIRHPSLKEVSKSRDASQFDHNRFRGAQKLNDPLPEGCLNCTPELLQLPSYR